MPITITATTDSPASHLRALSDFFLAISGAKDELLTSTALVSEAASKFGGRPGDQIKGSDAVVPFPLAVAGVEEAAEIVVPPPPVQSSIATEAAAIVSTAGVAVTLDASGFPWDERIHASSKALNADGTWRQKRGLNSSVLADVTAELRVKYPMPAPAPVVAPAPAVPLPPPATAAAAEVVIPPPPATAEPEVPVNFAQLMPHITAALRDKHLTMTQIIEACQAVGVPALPALGGRPDLVPTVFSLLFSASDE
jgi:hypothetical protein